MTIAGLCVFLDIARSTSNAWRDSRADLSEVIERVEMTIFVQKFEGAAADQFNADIISRELGLADRQEHTGKDGGAIETKDVSNVELARRIAFLLQRGIETRDAQTRVAETINGSLPSSSA